MTQVCFQVLFPDNRKHVILARRATLYGYRTFLVSGGRHGLLSTLYADKENRVFEGYLAGYE